VSGDGLFFGVNLAATKSILPFPLTLAYHNKQVNFKNYHHESYSRLMSGVAKKYSNSDHKTAVWNAFVDSELPGINDDDFSILPRLLPESYLPVIRKTAKDLTTFVLRLLTLPEAEVRAIIPRGPVRDFLINELEVLRFRPKRLTGSFRFDMALVGPLDAHHPPKILEINEIGFDGLARSTFFQKTLIDLIPELKSKVIALDTAAAEVRNMQRLGNQIARVQYDCYNWDEEYLLRTAQRMGAEVRLVSPTNFGCKIDDDYPLMKQEPFTFSKGRVKIGANYMPDALNMSFAYSLEDYKEGFELYRRLIRSKTPQYGPFLTGLVASKTVLLLLSDKKLRQKILGTSQALHNSVLPAFSLENNKERVLDESSKLVIKHVDGFGGEQVFMDSELLRCLHKIPTRKHHEWILQQKTQLNTIDVNGILSRPKRAISDLGVFVQYDWQDGKFKHFEMGGLMSRATNKGLKVNVSSGGLQAAVMLERGI
jgi:hypothetical protein